ncbi:MAG: hypothetical protein J1E40_07080 [Oscillospiraceae bacterium]|nr:hypothetical protein [Oscillospiraceae bacterium]
MHKNGKWAKQIISLQDEEGKWGYFHSMSKFSDSPITTEQALRRLERLGYTIEDECIQKAVRYMNDCLTGKNNIPDGREKIHDWDVFTSLILSAWIRRFTGDNPDANRVAKQWGDVVSAAFAGGTYNHDEYVTAYRDIIKPNGGRLVNFLNFYPISIVSDLLDEKTEFAAIDYILSGDNGIYYIYDGKISVPPKIFESRESSRYLAAVELLTGYKQSGHKLNFVIDWLNDNRNENGKWDMGKSVNDKMYFPLSDDWRKKETREADCTERITGLIKKLQAD